MGDPAPPTRKRLFNRRNKSMDYKGVVPDSVNLKKLIETGNLEGLKSILEKEKSAVRSIDAESQTLLHYACEFGQQEIAKYLLGKGLDVNAKNKFGWTPMILAVCHGHLAVALELSRKEDLDMSPKIPNSSRNVLHFLGRHWSPDSVPVLLQKCSPDVINAKDHQGDSPLHRVCIHCNVDCAKALVARGADVNLQNIHGETPLHYASRAGIEEIVSFLLDNGADPLIKGKHGTYRDVANSSTVTSSTSADFDDTLSSTPRLAHSSSAPISYASLAPPSLMTPPSKLSESSSRPSTPQSPTENSNSENSETPKSSESSENSTILAHPSTGATLIAAAVVVSTNEEASESGNPPPLPAKSSGTATPKALPATPAPAFFPASSSASDPASPASPTSPSGTRMSQVMGTVGTAVGAALGSAAQGNFSMKGTVKKLVEGILSTDLELPGFDTKKLFQKVVQLTNFKDILVKEIVPQLKTKLMATTLPAIAGAADTPIGEIQYEVWKISLSSLSFDDKSISCEPKLEGLKISMKLSAILKNIHFKYATHIMKDEGTATAEVQNISCVFILGLDIQNKQPKLKIKDTLVEMESLNLEIHKAKAKWLYNTIFGIISNKVKNQIGQLLTTTLAQQLSVLEGLFNDTLSLLWKKMRKKKKKKAIENPDTALITAQTAANLVVNEEILRIKAEIARTKLEVLKLSLPPPKGNEIKCYYYRAKSSSNPIIIMVDMKTYETVSELQKFIISEYTSLDSRLFPSRIAASIAHVKNNMKEIMQIAGSAGLTAVAAASAAPPTLPSRPPELRITGPAPTTPNGEQLIIIPTSSDELTTTSPPTTPPTTPPITPPITPPTSSSSFTLPNFTIPMPAKIEINSNSNSNKEKGAKKSVEWKFKDKEGDFVSITKRNTMQHIRNHALSLHIFEKRADD